MEARDLMVGDWVMYENEPIMVWEIDDYYERINTEPDGYNAITCVEISEVTPIPLTAEILEKNGFDVSDKEVMQYHFNEDGENYHFSLRRMYDKDDTPHGYSFYAFNVLTIIDYVHELQHALRLCGIDKEITL